MTKNNILINQWYDKEGKPMTDLNEVERKLTDKNYKIIKQTNLPDGKFVSTVWLGLNHNFNRTGPPIIFETMVFGNKRDRRDLDMDRYSTLEEARRGHEIMVNKWAGKKK